MFGLKNGIPQIQSIESDATYRVRAFLESALPGMNSNHRLLTISDSPNYGIVTRFIQEVHMNITRMLRVFFLGFVLTAAAGVFSDVALAQEQSGEMMTLEQFKNYLREEGKGRDLSQATHEELEKILPGGPLTERVIKIGISTFVINMAFVYVMVGVSFFVIVMFFTPVGLFLFRGNLHAFIGAVLKGSGIAKRFGEHLMKEPKRWLKKEKSVRDAFALYMHNEFIQEYKNNITAIAFLGTAFLICMIGLRGIKFMVAHEPIWIMIAIIIEVTVLTLLGLTTWYEKEEEVEGGEATGLPGKQLTLAQVEAKLDELKRELEASVSTETSLRQ